MIERDYAQRQNSYDAERQTVCGFDLALRLLQGVRALHSAGIVYVWHGVSMARSRLVALEHCD